MNTAKLITLGLLRSSGAAAFSPLSISGLVLWLDASDSATLFQDDAGTTPATADNDVVGYWGDKSGAGNHVTQATLASKPLLKLSTQNSQSGLLFDNTNDWMASALDVPSQFTAIVVYKLVSPGNNAAIGNNAAGRILQRYTAPSTITLFPNSTEGSFVLSATISAAASLLQLAFDYDADTYTATYNGVSVSNAMARTNPGGKILIGSSGAGERLNGYMLETLIFSRVLLSSEQLLCQSYLVSKWALTW